MNYQDNLDFYEKMIAMQSEIPRKGKANPYTSLNGHMFSFLGKDGVLGIRMSKEDKAAFEDIYNSPPFIQHNSVMNGYVSVPQGLLEDTDELFTHFNKGIAFIKTLKPKPSKKKK
jgi:hypothetical protein